MFKSHLFLTLVICTIASNAFSQSTDCKMKFSELQPIIERHNPFFADHSWNNDIKLETAIPGPGKKLTIEQEACIRHHIYVKLSFESYLVAKADTVFWITETLNLMNKLFFNQPDYQSFRKEFEYQLMESVHEAGPYVTSSFPVVERTFIFNVDKGDWGAKINLEIVRYLFQDKIRKPGINPKDDDGYFIAD